MASNVSSSPLLRLPRELRYEIYDLLCRKEPKSYPFRQPSISSIDQRAPPTALHLTCRYIREELQAYFYGKVTLRFMAQNVRRPGRENIDLASLTAIRQAKKVELRLHWHITPDHAELDINNLPYSMNGWLAEQVNLLLDEARRLELITLSVMDASENVEWASNKKILAPLQRLVGRVTFRVGEVVAADDEEAGLKEQLAAYVRELNQAELPASRTKDVTLGYLP
jgi:hypothetical protein